MLSLGVRVWRIRREVTKSLESGEQLERQELEEAVDQLKVESLWSIGVHWERCHN